MAPWLHPAHSDHLADLLSLISCDRKHGNGSELHKEVFRLDIRMHFFTPRVLKHWSRFHREVVDAPSFSVFKRYLDNALSPELFRQLD